MTEPPFRAGDLVRLKNGESKIQVLEVNFFDPFPMGRLKYAKSRFSSPCPGWFIRFEYLSTLRLSGFQPMAVGHKWREAEDFVLIQREGACNGALPDERRKPALRDFSDQDTERQDRSGDEG